MFIRPKRRGFSCDVGAFGIEGLCLSFALFPTRRGLSDDAASFSLNTFSFRRISLFVFVIFIFNAWDLLLHKLEDNTVRCIYIYI